MSVKLAGKLPKLYLLAVATGNRQGMVELLQLQARYAAEFWRGDRG